MPPITIRKILKSRTLRFSIALAVFGAIEANEQVLSSVFSEKFFGLFCMAVSLITAILRFMTTQPVAEKGEDNNG